MTTIEFILQGFTASTHIDVLRRLFDVPNIQRVLVSVAFVTEGGVEKIEAHLVPHAACATVFAGIRNDTTSYQALVRLHGMVNRLYIVDTGSRAVLFHPKLYLVRGAERARLVIGSANLTVAGLNNNIEAGMLLDFNLVDAADKALIDNIEKLCATSVTDYPDHIVQVGSVAYLDNLLAADRLIDELKILRHRDFRDSAYESDSGDDNPDSAEVEDSDGVSRIKLKVKPLRSGAAGTKWEPMERDGNKASNAMREVIVPPIVVPKIEFERESSVTHYLKRRAGEGPKLRARRARMEAKQLRKKWYYTGDPCRYGHDSDRLASNGKCRECNRLDSERSNRLGLYR